MRYEDKSRNTFDSIMESRGHIKKKGRQEIEKQFIDFGGLTKPPMPPSNDTLMR
jgi:hypothetical protein